VDYVGWRVSTVGVVTVEYSDKQQKLPTVTLTRYPHAPSAMQTQYISGYVNGRFVEIRRATARNENGQRGCTCECQHLQSTDGVLDDRCFPVGTPRLTGFPQPQLHSASTTESRSASDFLTTDSTSQSYSTFTESALPTQSSSVVILPHHYSMSHIISETIVWRSFMAVEPDF